MELRVFENLKDRLVGKLNRKQKRSPKWPEVRDAFLAIEGNDSCAVCGGKKRLQVHHIVPVSWPGGKELELDFDNLVTLCSSKKKGLHCHLFVGHLGNFRYANQNVLADIEYLKERMRVAREKYEKLKR